MDSLDTKLDLETILQSQNLCDEIKDDDLYKIGEECVFDFESDSDSMSDWREKNEKAFELIEHTFSSRSQPWHGAANAKFPLILNAAIRFNSEAGAEILKGDQLVKSEIFGQDHPEKTERARRVTSFMNYQLYHEMDNWDGDTDQLLVALPILGCVHKKVYYDPVRRGNVSELCLDNVTISQEATSIRSARISQEFTRDKDFIYEREALGLWREIEYSEEGDETEDKSQDFIEQHRRLDLDGDGYREPYIVTVHKNSKDPVRIVANFNERNVIQKGNKIVRIDPDCHFVKYGFIPAYDGSYWDIGWGILLGPLNDNVNSIVNQLLDAGTLANLQGGWISSSVRSKRGDNSFKPGEWKTVKVAGGVLRDSIVPLPIKEPSQVMFILLELLLDQGKDITSVNDIMQGDQPQANMSASSVMALIERGMKTFNAIYKRLYRSLKMEFKKLYALNEVHVDPQMYMEFHDVEGVNPKQDFGSVGFDVIPTANPEFSSRVQRMAQAEAMMNTLGHPNINDSAVLFRYYSAVLDDEKEAAQFVSQEPNMTPRQVLEQMEVMKQEVLDSSEVRTKQLDEKIKEFDLAIMELKLLQEQEKTQQKESSNAGEAALNDAQAFAAQAKGMKDLAEARAQEIESNLVESGVSKLLERVSGDSQADS